MTCQRSTTNLFPSILFLILGLFKIAAGDLTNHEAKITEIGNDTCKPPCWDDQGILFKAWAADDTKVGWYENWVEAGLATYWQLPKGPGVARHRFGDINGDGLVDISWIDPEDGHLNFIINPGLDKLIHSQEPGLIMSNGPNHSVYTEWARACTACFYVQDMNGDAKDDFIIYEPESGTLQVYLNKVDASNGTSSHGPLPMFKIPPGTDPNHVLLTFDKSLKVASCIIWTDEEGWLQYWAYPSPVAPVLKDVRPSNISSMFNTLFGKNFSLADIDGDSRDDMISWNSATTFTYALNLDFRLDGTYFSSTGFGNLNFTTNGPSDYVDFADVDGDGQDDYLIYDHAAQGWHIWLNKAKVTRPISHIKMFADYDGNKIDDYFQERSGVQEVGLNPWPEINHLWQRVAAEFPSAPSSTDQYSRLVDINGDSRADFVFFDVAHQNGFVNLNLGGNWNGNSIQLKLPSEMQTWMKEDYQNHTGFLQLADLDGDKLADLIRVDSSGEISVARNFLYGVTNQPSESEIQFGPRLQTYVPQKVDLGPQIFWNGGDVRFADMNGDGRSDFVVLEPTFGQLFVWLNDIDSRGNIRFLFNPSLNGSRIGTRKSNVRLASMVIPGRSDFVQIDPMTGDVKVSINRCQCAPVDTLAP